MITLFICQKELINPRKKEDFEDMASLKDQPPKTAEKFCKIEEKKEEKNSQFNKI